MSSGEWEKEILEKLDEAAEQFMFPGPPNEYYPHADLRLTAFRSPSEWLLVFEVPLFSRKDNEFQTVVSAYGNKLEEQNYQGHDVLVTGPEGSSLWDDDEFVLDKFDFEVEVDGKARHFKPSQADYEKAEIDTGDETMEDPLQVLRFIAHKSPDSMFLSDDRLLEIVERSDADLKRFLKLDDWQQPDPVEEERPSDLECWRSLAKALAENDKKLYSCPKKSFNTHWTNWRDEEPWLAET
jgi:hypothetical protein